MIPMCCGKPRMTKFCPDCGGPITQEPILSLLQYCRKRAAEERKHCSHHKKFVGSRPEFHSEQLEKHEARLNLLESYVSALVEMIEASRVSGVDS